MMDICIVIYRNYKLLDMQFEYWDKIHGDFRFIICDNTPQREYRPIEISRQNMIVYRNEFEGIDGEKHGGALDFLVRKTETDIIGICDSDFFWLDPNIANKAVMEFEKGCKCYGVELWYKDFNKVNKRYPDRAGWLAPCVFGMFVDRKLALTETFVVTRHEGEEEWKETGWRLRQRIIRQNIPCHVVQAFKYPEQKGSIFYGKPQDPVAFHWVKGSSHKVNQNHQIPELLALKEKYAKEQP